MKNILERIKATVSEVAHCSVHPTSYVGRKADGSWYTLCVAGHRKLKSGEMSNCKIVVETQEEREVIKTKN